MLYRSVLIAGGQVCCSYLGASYPLHTFENSVQLFLILQKVCQTMCCNSDDEDVEKRCFANCKKNLQTVDIILDNQVNMSSESGQGIQAPSHE